MLKRGAWKVWNFEEFVEIDRGLCDYYQPDGTVAVQETTG
jgi:hypothetical protein